ncbi:MAG: Cys-tRNA(Pro) deacylase [Xanthobacteraceae bacterium]|jgi:Cys-tRNA(Pro)/Cys-tRNA(Cys) deacylase|uniref:Cys-tRNA(Pro) deacylase n=1 Tax=Pseudolabrys sp. TaxID=1960880 RepID=UPI003D105D1F
MARATPATQVLERSSVPFTLHEYQYDPSAENIGLQAARALGILPIRLLKTLMTKVDDNVVCVLMPSNRDVNFKKLAAAANAKSAAMLPPADAERLTGYHIGGISPFGQKRPTPVFLEKTVLAFPSVFVNGGQRGLQIELATKDLARVLKAVAAEMS